MLVIRCPNCSYRDNAEFWDTKVVKNDLGEVEYLAQECPLCEEQYEMGLLNEEWSDNYN